MSNTFSFDDGTLGTDSYLTQGQLTRSSSRAPAVAVSSGQTISSSGDVDILAVTLVAGRSYQFDIDQGFGDSSGGSVDLQLSLINARGSLVLTDSGSDGTDSGSSSTRDPLVSVSVNTTGRSGILPSCPGLPPRTAAIGTASACGVGRRLLSPPSRPPT